MAAATQQQANAGIDTSSETTTNYLQFHVVSFMAKGGKKRSRVGGSTATGGGGATTSAATANWSAADHAARHGKASQTPARVDRTAWLTHDTREKREGMKLQLHVKQTKRQVEVLRKRLQRWDPVEEKIAADQKKQKEEAAEAERLRLEEESLLPASQKRVRRRRAGPETWKLRGAARPAHEVYDFDVRYECPHVLAHTEAAAQAGRVQNLLQSHNNNANNTLWFDPHGIPECREYLGLLMQLGHVCQEAKQYKSAREAWLECVALDGGSNNNDNSATNEGEPLTSARDALMRLYMQLHKYKDAYKLGTEFANDPSVWIRYHAALAACQLDHEDQQQCMVEAVMSNIFCAYYLVHYKDTFSKVMEYTEELEDAETEPQSSLEEAIEYCGKISARKSFELTEIIKEARRYQHPITGQVYTAPAAHIPAQNWKEILKQ